jgi:CheY-like chemotaxis protein
VLLVDDAPLNLRLVSRLLLRHGFASVATAADGEQALRLLVAPAGAADAGAAASCSGAAAADAAAPPPRFHAVLMDMQMPVMSGPESARAFRAWETAQRPAALAAAPEAGPPPPPPPLRLPIVAFAANALEEAHAECRAAGMCDVATKPLWPEAIAALRARATAHARQQQRAAAAAVASARGAAP